MNTFLIGLLFGAICGLIGAIVERIRGTNKYLRLYGERYWEVQALRGYLGPHITIEAGQFYRTRAGEVVGPVSRTTDARWPNYATVIADEHGGRWNLGGESMWHLPKYDLVEICPTPDARQEAAQ